MNAIQFFGALETGLIYGLVAIGIYLSIRTLQFPDLTVDGSYPLGAAVCASLITSGSDPFFATFVAIMAGGVAGLLTAWLSTQLKMLNLLAGILTMSALYSINIRVMGRPNVALLGEKTIFNQWQPQLPSYIPLMIIVSIIVWLIYKFLSTNLGLAIRATGNNPRMSRAQGISDHHMIWLGLALSNALVAFAGALFAQLHGFADVTMGVGTIIIGLASVIIGETLFSTRTVWQALIACVLGTIIYRLVIALALNIEGFGLKTSDLQLETAILVILAMLLPILRHSLQKGKEKVS